MSVSLLVQEDPGGPEPPELSPEARRVQLRASLRSPGSVNDFKRPSKCAKSQTFL